MSTAKILQLRLTDQLGNYLIDARICLISNNGKKTEVKTDYRGLAFLKVPIGSYRLKADCQSLYRDITLNLQRDESLTVMLFPENAARLTIQTLEKDKKVPFPSYIIIRGNNGPAFPGHNCPEGAVFTDDNGITSILLPPGEFTIKATHGFTYQPVEKTVILKKGDSKTVNFILQEEFKLPSGWYSGDDHVHCFQCWPGHHPECPDFSVNLTANAARANGLDWFTPTDNLDPASNLYMPVRAGEGEGKTIRGQFLCLVGDETDGHNKDGPFHCNLIGIKTPIGSKGNISRMNNVLEEVLRQGGTANICHIFLGSGAIREIEDTPELPNLEVWCCQDDIDKSMPVWYDFLNRGRKLYAVAHSDSTTLYWPGGSFVGVRRTYIYIGKKKFSKEAIISSLKNGHSFCTDGPLLFFKVNGKIPGETLKGRGKIEVEIKAFSLTPLTKIALIASGKKIREWTASGNYFQVKEELESGDFSWILATAEAEKTIYSPARKFKGFAFTNPIWI